MHQEGRFYRLSTGRAAHYENIKPHNASSEDWCIPADIQERYYLIVDPACEVNERDTRDKNDGNEVVDNCDLPLELDGASGGGRRHSILRRRGLGLPRND